MAQTINKNDAKALIDQMPDDATWDDLVEEICLRIAVERGLADVAAGRVRSVQDVRRELGLPE